MYERHGRGLLLRIDKLWLTKIIGGIAPRILRDVGVVANENGYTNLMRLRART